MKYPKMNAHWKDWWLRALRGGNYKQCKGVLRNRYNKCCCFGVLADGMAPQSWLPGVMWRVGEEGAQVRLPPSLQNRARVPMGAVVFLERKNDRDGWTFAQIADWVEQNL